MTCDDHRGVAIVEDPLTDSGIDLGAYVKPQRWECAKCPAVAVTTTEPGMPMHPCPGFAGMVVPLAPAGERIHTRLVAREDYINGDDVQRDAEGRVWMSAHTTSDSGEAVTVYAPTAHSEASA